MAAESSSASTGRSSSGASADSYIGSLISLTSKSEIRYEGILYNINTDESSIGLRNVRSFGTEGRKKDGPQVPPGDKIYEYILFRGSDIKDLQVKSSPPVQTAQAAPPVHNDPAIIQSHYSRPPLSSTLPSAVGGSLPDLGSHNSNQMGFPGSTFQGGPPLYQPGGTMNSWGPSPPPMYWPGYYGTPNGLPQQPLLRPPPGLSVPPPMQQFPYPVSSMAPGGPGLQVPNLTEYPSPLAPNTSTPLVNLSSLPTSTLPLSISTMEHPMFPSVTSNLMSNKTDNSSIPAISSSTLPAFSPLAPVSSADLKPVAPSVPNKSNTIPAPVFQQPIKTQPATAVAGIPSASIVDTPTLPLVTPGQFLQGGSTSVSINQPLQTAQKDLSLNQPSQTAQKDVEVVQVSTMSSDPPAPLSADAQPPILPLPSAARSHRPNGAPFHGRFNYRGRGGRGNGMARPVTRFAEDFDFEAMNEKFNKDEVWGHLGKSNKHSKEEVNGNDSDEDYSQEEYEAELPKVEIKPVYNKDDFFDSLSSNTAHNEPNNGWTRFSEQKKIDTETFGDFARYRGGRGGRGPFRGGRSRGSSYGRGGYGYNNNYAGRGGGRGRGVSSRDY